jgi:hypothetical protein
MSDEESTRGFLAALMFFEGGNQQLIASSERRLTEKLLLKLRAAGEVITEHITN